MKKGFVSQLIAALAILALITLISMEWSLSATQQANIAGFASKKVYERASDAQSFYNSSQIESEVDAAYLSCGCFANTVGNFYSKMNGLAPGYFNNVSKYLTGSVVSQNYYGLYTKNTTISDTCNASILSDFNYTIITNSSQVYSIIPVNQTDNISISNTASIFNVTVMQGTDNHLVEQVIVNCSR